MSYLPADAQPRPRETGWSRRLGQGLLLLVLASVIVPHGSPDLITGLVASVFFGLVAMVSLATEPRQPDNTKVANEVLLLCGILAAYVVVQILSFEGNPLSHDIWLRAEGLLAKSGSSISVEPSSTYAALFPLLTPLIAFYAVVRLFDSGDTAQSLLKYLALFGFVFGVYGAVQMQFFPDGLIVRASGGSRLTGFFVNRNISGAFLGIASLASISWLMSTVSTSTSSRKDTHSRRYRRETVYAAICTAVCVLCLFLTQSRGAMVSSLIAFATLIVPIASNAHGLMPGWSRNWGNRTRVSILACLILVTLILIVEFLGRPTTARLVTEGADFARLCIYEATLKGMHDGLLFGTGLGTYATAFQQYRPTECVSVELNIFRAHNTFLEALFCLGLLALPLFAYAYSRMGWILLDGYRRRQRLRHVTVAGFAGIVLVTVHSMMDFPVQIPGFAAYFACYLGAVTSICNCNPRALPRSRLPMAQGIEREAPAE